MLQLQGWYDDYNSYHPHSALRLFGTNRVQEKTIGKFNIPAVLDYGVKTSQALVARLVDDEFAPVAAIEYIVQRKRAGSCKPMEA